MGGICVKDLPVEHIRAQKYMAEEKHKRKGEIKILLLGTGESGKSTVTKQMRIIHTHGYSDTERLEHKSTVIENIVSAMITIIGGANKYNYSLSAQAQADADILTKSFTNRHVIESDNVTETHKQALIALWADSTVQSAYQNYAAELQLPSSTEYFFNDMSRVLQSTFVPNDQDVLRARRATTGVHMIEFTSHGITFKCVDVGGQRTERRKWLHVFDDVTAVLFCVAMDEYNLKMREDESVWRIHESLQLFNEIANSTHLSSAAMILFLNKKDLFEEKIAKVDLTITFPEYAGGKNYRTASEYLTVQFSSLTKFPEKLYTHLTCATNTENIKVVFNAIRDMLLGNVLSGAL